MCQWKLLCIMQHILDAKLMGSFGHSGTLVAPGLSHLRRLARVRDLPFAKACRSLAVQHSAQLLFGPRHKDNRIEIWAQHHIRVCSTSAGGAAQELAGVSHGPIAAPRGGGDGCSAEMHTSGGICVHREV